MTALIVQVPAKYRRATGCPPGPLTVCSSWEMPAGKIGVWLKAEGSDRVYPVTRVSREQVLSWQVTGADE